jgi:hypothetical protein
MEPNRVIIHVRFAPNGTVVEIGERPPVLTPQEWFNLLSDKAGSAYQTFSGGRGVFRLTPGELEGFRAEYSPSAA